jgi:hypothetical protein
MMIEVGFSNPSFSFGQFGRKELYLISGAGLQKAARYGSPSVGTSVRAEIRNRSGTVIKEFSDDDPPINQPS